MSRLWQTIKESKEQVAWYRASNLSSHKALILGGAIYILMLSLNYSPLGDWLTQSWMRPLEFRTRSWLNRDPKLHPMFAIYAYDEKTFAKLESDELSLSQWQSVLQNFAAVSPKAIFISKIFGAPRGMERASKFSLAVAALKIPIISLGFLSKDALSFRSQYPLTQRIYAPEYWTLDPSPSSTKESFVYGAHPKLHNAFSRMGHAHYSSESFTFQPILKVKNKLLPAAALLLAESAKIRDGSLYLNKKNTGSPAFDEVLVNFSDPHKSYYSETLTLLPRLQSPPTKFPPGAYIFILPDFISGNSKMVSSPFGRLPAGYAHIAMANSVLTGQWLKVVHQKWFFLFLFALLGGLTAYFLNGKPFWISLVLGTLGITVFGLGLFSCLSFEFPWLPSSLSYVSIAFVLGVEKIRTGERKANLLKQSLEGAISPERLQRILAQKQVSFDPSSQVVSVMFLDIASFYLITERQQPREAFEELKALMSFLTEIVHAHGGVIDRSLGDGMLCFFGYDFESGHPDEAHAKDAIQCAVKLQRANLERNLKRQKKGKSVYQLRIGLNTTSAFIGDLGSKGKIDLTLIGSGVSFSQRLETACENNRILMGASTHALLGNYGTELGIRQRLIQIKHYDALLEAYEAEPLGGREADLSKLIQYANNFIGIKREEDRWPVPDSAGIILLVDINDKLVEARLKNFSLSGLGLELGRYLGKGSVIRFGPSLRDEPRYPRGLFPVRAQIRWGRKVGKKRYLHGLSFSNLNSNHKTQLFEAFRKLIEAHTSKKKTG